MKVNFKKIFHFNNILWILIITLVIIIGYNLFVNLKIYEGVTNMNIKYILIEPAPGTRYDWLNLAEVTLYDQNDETIPYTMISKNGTYRWGHYPTEQLQDSNENMFHSGWRGDTMTLTITPPNAKVVRIKIMNRQDCCQRRITSYQITLKNEDDHRIGMPFRLENYPKLLDPNAKFTENIILVIPGDKGANGVNGSNGGPGSHGLPGADGVKGIQGPPGDKGDRGPQGDPGVNAIVTVNNKTGLQVRPETG